MKVYSLSIAYTPKYSGFNVRYSNNGRLDKSVYMYELDKSIQFINLRGFDKNPGLVGLYKVFNGFYDDFI